MNKKHKQGARTTKSGTRELSRTDRIVEQNNRSTKPSKLDEVIRPTNAPFRITFHTVITGFYLGRNQRSPIEISIQLRYINADGIANTEVKERVTEGQPHIIAIMETKLKCIISTSIK